MSVDDTEINYLSERKQLENNFGKFKRGVNSAIFSCIKSKCSDIFM